jgi:hypothetical protein
MCQTPDIPGLLGEIAIARGAARHAPASAASFVMAQDVAAARMRVIALTRDALLAGFPAAQASPLPASSPERDHRGPQRP